MLTRMSSLNAFVLLKLVAEIHNGNPASIPAPLPYPLHEYGIDLLQDVGKRDFLTLIVDKL